MSDILDVSGLLKAGWAYHDLPKMRPSYWRWILDGFGEGEFHLLSHAQYWDGEKVGEPNWERGQIIVSPKGRENLDAYRKANPLPTDGADSAPPKVRTP